MAKIRTINGDFSGKIGPVVLVNGKTGKYLRALPKKNDKKSEGQVKQRTKLKVVNDFLKPIKEFLPIGFVQRDARHNPYQAATSLLLKHAFKEDSEMPELNFANVLICQGTLAMPQKASVSVSDHVIIFRWEDNSKSVCAKATDKLVFMLYDIEHQHAIWGINETSREEEHHLYLADNDLVGIYQGYIAFINSKETEISNSVYVGEIELKQHINDEP